MTTTSKKLTNILKFGEIVQHDGYTMQEAGTIQLGKSSFDVKLQAFPNGEVTTWLHGARGAEYILQPLSSIENSGKYRIMSFGSGAFLRRAGNEVRIFMFGNLIEEI